MADREYTPVEKETSGMKGWLALVIVLTILGCSIFFGENLFLAEKDRKGEEEKPAAVQAAGEGHIMALQNVSPEAHTMKVRLISDSIVDYTGIFVKKYGRNLLDSSGFEPTHSSVTKVVGKDGSISFEKAEGSVGAGVRKTVYLPKGTYCISFLSSQGKNSQVKIVGENGQEIFYARGLTHTFEIQTSGNYQILLYGSYTLTEPTVFQFSELQLEAGEQTGYTPFVQPQTLQANADGTIDGISSTSPYVTFLTDADGIIDCVYEPIENCSGMVPGQILKIGTSVLKKNMDIFFRGGVEQFGGLRIFYGESTYGAAYVEITESSVDVYRHSKINERIWSMPHGLTICHDLRIRLTTDQLGNLTIAMTSDGNSFTAEKCCEFGGTGDIKAESLNSYFQDVTFTWDCLDFDKEIWILGDSYVSLSENRWPYYLLQEKDNFRLSGFSGAKSEQLYAEFLNGLTYGKPACAVWCLGMNDPDRETEINPQWMQTVENFLSVCREQEILPILATIPNVPGRNHMFKNAYVRNSGCRYIDFASAVAGETQNSPWTEGMLHTDNLHPTALGAQALAEQVLQDIPELR